MRWVCRIGILLCVAAAMGAAAESYRSPDTSTNIFGGELTIDATDRAKAATALAALARNKLDAADPNYLRNAARLVGLALILDSSCKDAHTIDEDLSDGRTISKTNSRPRYIDRMLQQIRIVAQGARDSMAAPDRTAAAYLYSAMVLAASNDDDSQQIDSLKKDGIAVHWEWADGFGTTTAPSGKAQHRMSIRPVVEVRGLVVSLAADGLWHGKTIDLIATTRRTQQKAPVIKAVQPMGPEMRISFNEAIRLVKLRHEQLSNVNVEVSFGDKYSEKDGGSAGTAFTLLMLSALGGPEINPDAAMTGDITVDSKIRPVGEVPAKVHGAALDHCKLVAIPADNVDSMDDAELLAGPTALWETHIFSIATLDDAIAVMRIDPSSDMTEAQEMFNQLKAAYGTKSVSDLKTKVVQDKLAEIVALAPNDVSAAGLLRLAQGNGPTHLSVLTTLEQAFAGIGPLRAGLSPNIDAGDAPQDTVDTAHQSLWHLRRIADPSAAPVVTALDDFCTAYGRWANSAAPMNSDYRKQLLQDVQTKAEAVRTALNKVASDPAVIDKLMHQG